MENQIVSLSNTTVTHVQENQRYRITYERGATKGVTGYKVEANGDDMNQVAVDAHVLRVMALGEAGADGIAMMSQNG